MLLASYTIGHCLDPTNRAGKWENVDSADYHRISPESQRGLGLDFVHRKNSLRFVDFLQVRCLKAV